MWTSGRHSLPFKNHNAVTFKPNSILDLSDFCSSFCSGVGECPASFQKILNDHISLLTYVSCSQLQESTRHLQSPCLELIRFSTARQSSALCAVFANMHTASTHIFRVNKPITIVFNCLEMEGEDGGEERTWRPLIACDSGCVLPSLGSIDTGRSILRVG